MNAARKSRRSRPGNFPTERSNVSRELRGGNKNEQRTFLRGSERSDDYVNCCNPFTFVIFLNSDAFCFYIFFNTFCFFVVVPCFCFFFQTGDTRRPLRIGAILFRSYRSCFFLQNGGGHSVKTG